MPPGNRESEAPDPDDLNSAEAAEAAAAAAEARAEAARARANELRRKLAESRDEAPAVPETGTDPENAEVDTTEGTEPAPAGDIESPAAPDNKRRRRLPVGKTIAAAVAILAIIGLLGGTGWMVWKHQDAEAQRHRTAEFSAAARQGVVNLMSMDFNQAKESVQRVIDDSTGKFKANFQDGADDLIKAMQQSKVVTKVTVNDTAVESMDKDSATVLVAATSQRTGPDAPKEDQQPRVWRVVVSLQRDGDQLKVSDVEFA
ncbi:hypothetical protein [Mycolicibacterium aichiense]|nr:hypothetical protein [Mycolicibacterium aichiense]MCV7021738.1 hypothetical protein [Mycolicibacterium aichiense]STZ82806.1 VirB8 protein [Mycolicibacterium aichiense]